MGEDTKNTEKRDNGQKPDGPVLSYEEMKLDGQRYLCQIPQVSNNDDRNETRAEPDEAEEKKELARATDRGLELLHEMEGKCMYYVSGWWSYSLCYQRQIKQFHALPSGSGIPSYPPTEDPTTHSFVLGKFPRKDDEDDMDGEPTQKKTSTDVAQLQTKGGSRYLVQRLQGGTTCDLTGRSRKIEIQFHCHPQSTDRIGWIKELTTCSYLMVVYTPRLCNDVAFLPPQQDEVHPVECREILSPQEVSEWEAMREYHVSQQLVDSGNAALDEVPIVGDIKVGGQKLVGKEGKQIEKGRMATIGEEKVEVLAKRENGEVKRLSKDELKKYDLDPEKIETLRKRLEEVAQGKDWTLEIVEANGERGLRGIVDTDEEDEGEREKPGAIETPAAKDEQQQKQQQEKPEEQGKQKQDAKEKNQPEQEDEAASEGSEEVYFKDEL